MLLGDRVQAHRGVGIEVATHVLNLELELALATLLSSLRRRLICV
jgi:ABC-type proline/glycine betaine transport system permease subunit